MTSPKEFLARLVPKLEAAGIPYMVVGSLASGYYGEARATNDADLVIEVDSRRLEQLLDQLGGEYYVSPTAAQGGAATADHV